MKTLLTTLLILFSSIIIIAQEVYDTYELDFYMPHRAEFELLASEDRLFTDVYAEGKEFGEAYLHMNEKGQQKLMQALKQVKPVFLEWSKTAEDNDVKDYLKEIKVKKRVFGGVSFFYGSKWRTNSMVELKFYFWVDEEGNHKMIISSANEIKSSDNQFMKLKSMQIVFSSVEEIDDFMRKFNSQYASEFLKKKSDKDDLFKQN